MEGGGFDIDGLIRAQQLQPVNLINRLYDLCIELCSNTARTQAYVHPLGCMAYAQDY